MILFLENEGVGMKFNKQGGICKLTNPLERRVWDDHVKESVHGYFPCRTLRRDQI